MEPSILDHNPLFPVRGHPRKRKTDVEKFRERNIAKCWECKWLSREGAERERKCLACMERESE